jgi:hypothetical protein
MAIRVVCPSCRRRIRVPDHLAGKRVTCPRCDEALRVPAWGGEPTEPVVGPVPGAGTAYAEDALPLSGRLGVVALALGLCAVLVLCLPVIGYVGIALSALGLLLGLGGLAEYLKEASRGRGVGRRAARSLPVSAHPVSYPLAGTAVCLAALALALLPMLFR